MTALDVEISGIELARVAGIWLLLAGALPITGAFCDDPKHQRRFFFAGLAFAIGAALAFSPADMVGRGLGSFALIIGVATLPAFLVASMISLARKQPFISCRKAFCALLAAIALTSAGAAGFVRDVQDLPQGWTPAPLRLRADIASAMKESGEKNFRIAAVSGVFTEGPADPDPINRLALWLFSQRLSPALQPGRGVAGVLFVEFVPDPASIEMSAVPDIRGWHECRGVVHGQFTFRLGLLGADGKSAPDVVSTERLSLVFEGRYNPIAHQLRLHAATPSRANTI